MQSASFYIFILIYSSIVATIYYMLEVKSSFEELNKIFARNEPNEYKNLNYLLQNLSKKTNAEFAIYNSKFARNLVFISFMIATLFLINLPKYGNAIFLLIGLILFSPEIYIYSKKTTILKQNSIQNMVVKKRINLAISIISSLVSNLANKYLKLLIYNFVVLTFILIIFLFLQKVYQLENVLNFNSLLLNFNSLLLDTIESTINTELFYNDKPLDVVSGNKLSFSGILFTLGIGGTIIFSLVDNYNEQKEIINRNACEIKKYYQIWFQSKKDNLNFDPNKYDEFNSIVSYLRNKLDAYIQLNNNVIIYRLTKVLIIVVYLMGIFVMIGSDSVTGFIFKVFPLVSILFISVIFYLFYCFKNSIFYSTEKTNSSSGKNHSIYEFTDTSQDGYSEIIIE